MSSGTRPVSRANFRSWRTCVSRQLAAPGLRSDSTRNHSANSATVRLSTGFWPSAGRMRGSMEVAKLAWVVGASFGMRASRQAA